ncbi:MAG: PAS domain S-box protein [Candidatus Methanoperedens sp.]|nr:PAS domain S-box protein [Candidatus Methanoperedens sp.]
MEDENKTKEQLINELKELRNSEERYRALYEESPSMYFTVDTGGRVLSINNFGAKQLGYSVEELVGQPIFKVIYEDDKKVIHQEITVCLQSAGCIAVEELRKVRKDGTILWVKEVARSIPVAGGSMIILIVCEDITDRKRMEEELRRAHDELEARIQERTAELIKSNRDLQAEIEEHRRAEEALRESEKRYRYLVETTFEGIWTIDPDGKTSYANQRAAEMLGYAVHEMLGMQPLDFVFPDDIPLAKQGLELQKERPREEFDFRLRHRNGSEVWVHAINVPIFDEQGEYLGALAMFTDITERKRAEEQLRESEKRYRNLIELTTDIIYLSDREGRQVFVNDAGYSLLEATPEEVIGYTWEKWIYPDDREKTYKKFREMIEHGTDLFGFENRFVSKSGRIIYLLHNARLLRDEKGNISGTQGIARDISERKRTEEERERWVAELARSNAELEQFAYIASHDLQEPLRMVSGFIQLLAKRYRDRLDKNANEFIDFIVDGTTRMQRMIEDLLAYSRVGTRGKPFEPTDCEAVFNQAVTNLKVTIEQNNATVTHDPLPAVMADSTQMVQLFQNLISNGIKYRREEPPRIHVFAQRKENEWIFSVRDNGIGIAPEFFKHLFQIFQREHPAKEYPGTGIGLAVCKRIVERHGGRIWAESEAGKGSTFYFTIPLR